MAFWNTTSARGHIHRVLYEDVVRFPEKTARNLLDICGLPWDPTVLQFADRAAQRTVATASVLQVRRPLYQDSIGAYKNFLPGLGSTLLKLDDLIRTYEDDAGLAATGWTSMDKAGFMDHDEL